MAKRPIIQPKLATIDKLAEILGWLTIIALCGFVIFNYSELPERIPTQFNFSGQIVNYGAKSTLFIFSILGTITFAGLTIVNKYPNTFNYLVKITEENAARQYTFATRMIRFLKLAIGIVFLGIVVFTSLIADGKMIRLGNWFIPVILGLILSPIVFYIMKSLREN